MLPAIIVEGACLWIDPPLRQRWQIDREWEERDRRHRAEQEKLRRMIHGDAEPLSRKYAPPYPIPPLKIIHLRGVGTETGDPNYYSDVAIDLDKRRICWDRTSGNLLRRPDYGSGAIGVIIFSAPFLLPVSPFLLLLALFYRVTEKEAGMSRHGSALLKSLRGQLDAETETLLVEALKNEWQREREASRRVSLLEAAEILDCCDLREVVITDEDAAKRGDVGSLGLHWFDERDEQVAHASFYGERDHYVQVRGSTFFDKDADYLASRYRTRTVTDLGKDDNEGNQEE